MYQDITIKESSGFTSEQAATRDYLITPNFRVDIPNCPLLSRSITKCSVPKINIGSASQMTPQVNVPHMGDSLITAPFVVSFPVYADLSNYLEVYNWIYSMFSDDFVDQRNAQAKRLYGIGKTTKPIGEALNLDNYYVDSSLIMYDRNNNESCNVKYIGMFPTDLSEISFDAVSDSQEPVYATAVFKYMYHVITPTKK
jgi:hypothetical protein